MPLKPSKTLKLIWNRAVAVEIRGNFIEPEFWVYYPRRLFASQLTERKSITKTTPSRH